MLRARTYRAMMNFLAVQRRNLPATLWLRQFDGIMALQHHELRLQTLKCGIFSEEYLSFKRLFEAIPFQHVQDTLG